MGTFRRLLNEISAFGNVDDENADENVHEILHNVKCLITDSCAVNFVFCITKIIEGTMFSVDFLLLTM